MQSVPGGSKAPAAALIALVALMALSACSGRSSDEPRLMNFPRGTDGPDEFAIVPTRPLEMPTNFASLPTPSPGGINRADPQPRADAVAALGGNPAALQAGGAQAGGVPAVDGALVARAGRFGVESNIRGQLAAEDLEFRRRNQGRLLERMFNVSVYSRAYRPLALDAHTELERWRAANARTPAAPPDPRLD